MNIKVFDIYIGFLIGIFGACMGSFLNCMATRIVHDESIVKGRSHCDKCNHVLSAVDLIPVFSFLLNKGKCRYCGAKLPITYLLSEIFSAVVFVSIFIKYKFSLDTIQYLLFASILLAVSFADIEGMIIPDRFIVSAIVIRAIFILMSGDIVNELIFSALGGFTVAGVLLIVVLLFEKIIGKEAMGGGDIKLLFVTGLYLGWKKNILCLFISCIVGILFGLIIKKDEDDEESKPFPFGPSIAMAAWIVLLFGDAILNAYLNLYI